MDTSSEEAAWSNLFYHFLEPFSEDDPCDYGNTIIVKM